MMAFEKIVYTTYSGLQNFIAHPVSSSLWLLLMGANIRYQNKAYLQQVYLIDQIHLCKDLDTIKINTVAAHMSYNLVAMFRSKVLNRNTTQASLTFPIEAVNFSPKDDPTSKVLRLELDGRKFFCARQRASYMDPELIGAIFT